jgi:predicted nucleic acid-binding protein
LPLRPAIRAFFDSSILVYAFSAGDSQRRAAASDLMKRHTLAGSLVISVQVLMETYNVLTRKHAQAPGDVLNVLRLLVSNEVVVPDAEVVLMALTMCAGHKLSTWNPLIVQAALEADCEVLYSEDLQSGRRFGTLKVVNPFTTQGQEAWPSYGPAPTSARAVNNGKPKPKRSSKPAT